MSSECPIDLDPLNLEVVERALAGAQAAMKENGVLDELESDQDLEAALRRELIEIARLSGVSEAEALRDALLALTRNEIVGDEGAPWLSGG
jgi:hypothetical protein